MAASKQKSNGSLTTNGTPKAKRASQRSSARKPVIASTKSTRARSASPANARGSKAKAPTKAKAPRSTRGGLAAHARALAELRAFGLALPEAHTKSPWPGHADLAVRDKTFAYLNDEGPLSISCKLPQSCHEALGLPFSTPTEYGLGKSGWVTATFAASDEPPVAFLKAWIEESYRAQAPKRLVKALDARQK